MSSALDGAWALHRAGRYDEAERGCLEIVAREPRDGGAWHLAGLARFRMGRHAEAEDAYRRAIESGSTHAEIYSNLGTALAVQGRIGEAAASFRRAIELAPGLANAHCNLGTALRDLGQLEEAASSLREALRLNPDHPGALTTLADVYSRLDRPADLVEACRVLLVARPAHFEALHRRGEALTYLNDYEAALACFREAVRLMPASQSAENGLGIALARLEREGEAVPHFRRALALSPTFAEAWNNLGRALLKSGELEEALASLDEAIRLRPDYAEAQNNRATVFNAMRRFEQVLPACHRAIELVPDHVDAHINRAMTYLMLGDYARGWPEFEWRWKNPATPPVSYPRPLWRGEPPEGKTILLTTEQGVGDVIQLVRFAATVRARGAAEVFIHAPDYLVDLLRTTSGVDRVISHVPDGPDPGFDLHGPLLNLPGILGLTVETIPAPIPYLTAESARVDSWRDRLATVPGYRVGIAWRGNPKNPMDRARSFPLASLEPLARVEGVRLISLQKGHGTEEITGLDGRFPVVEFADLDAGPSAFVDTAALMENLDLVVSADTATIHLAGALGVPAWLPLSTEADWRWFPDREDSPWYPSVRLFRQQRPREWGPVFDRIAAALEERVGAPRIVVEIAPGELIDKITILEIKVERISDAAKLANVHAELALLGSARDRAIAASPELDEIARELRVVNEAIWDVEDELRACERRSDFGAGFIEAARSVYRNNDRRAALKRLINDRLRSRLIEEKFHGGCS